MALGFGIIGYGGMGGWKERQDVVAQRNEVLQPQLAMLRKLADLPECVMPAGYSIRHYQPGDGPAWDEIMGDSFGDATIAFDKAMRADPAYVPERVLFVCCDANPVATASAWYRPKWGANSGYLHMVGTHSSHTGKGLGLQASLAALHRMVREGRELAILQTDDFRIPAIKTYIRLGFRPMIVHENQPRRWRGIFSLIERLELIDEFSAILDGPVVKPERGHDG